MANVNDEIDKLLNEIIGDLDGHPGSRPPRRVELSGNANLNVTLGRELRELHRACLVRYIPELDAEYSLLEDAPAPVPGNRPHRDLTWAGVNGTLTIECKAEANPRSADCSFEYLCNVDPRRFDLPRGRYEAGTDQWERLRDLRHDYRIEPRNHGLLLADLPPDHLTSYIHGCCVERAVTHYLFKTDKLRTMLLKQLTECDLAVGRTSERDGDQWCSVLAVFHPVCLWHPKLWRNALIGTPLDITDQYIEACGRLPSPRNG